MKKFRKLACGLLCAACLTLSVAACNMFPPPDTYSVGGEDPIPSITQVVGDRPFEGSSATLGGGGDEVLSQACSYENIEDVAQDLSLYITTLTTTYGFTATTPLDPKKPEQGAVLTKPAAKEGHTLTLTITVPSADSYRIELKSAPSA